MPKNLVKASTPAFLLVAFLVCLGFTSQPKADITASLSDGDTLELIGIGMYQELRNDIYIGALFGPQSVTSVEQLKDDNVAKRMSLRFVSDYSNRKLARHWKERMAMNNPRNQWQPLTREIVGFSKLFKRSLVPGDEINIDHVPGVGTQVYLNGTLFVTFNKSGFVDVLLNVWLGNIPPTKAFKTSIRGQDAAQTKSTYIAQYSAFEPVKGRFDADLKPPTPVRVATAPPKAQPPAEKPKVTRVAKKEPAKKPPTVAQNKPATPPPANTQPKNDGQGSEVAAKPAPKVVDNTPKPETKKPPVQKPAPKKVAKVEPPPVEEDFFDADLITGSYTRDLINSIREHQEYPRKALIKKQEGDVTAKVTIAADGSIVNVEITERSGSRILDKAASRIIKKAAPFQAIPNELKQNEFVFDVPMSFQL